jgi:hypothetical protein
MKVEQILSTADSKATVLKTLNILHKKFQIGIKLQYQVVVGDRKCYDHLIKLKSEYGGSLSWVLPYHGDWHILFLIRQFRMFWCKICYNLSRNDFTILF